jgi:hypothetical protein
VIVTVNGSYLNLWVSDGDGGWTNTECQSSGDPVGYLQRPLVQVMLLAEEFIGESIRSEDEGA